MKKIIITLLLVFFTQVIIGCKEGVIEKKYYINPLTLFTNADPSVIEHNGYFYVFSTNRKILKSKDLIDFEDLGYYVESLPTWGTAGAGMWAPDIVKVDNEFLVYYSLSRWDDSDPGIGIASSNHPEGPWTDEGKLFKSSEIGVNNSIDPTVFYGEDGKLYMIWGSFRGLYGVELASDGRSVISSKTLVAGFETNAPWNGGTYEAPYVRFINGYYYMFVSSGLCCEAADSTYNVRVARSTSPLGPYTDHRGRTMLDTYRGYEVLEGSSSLVGPGHNAIIKDDNNDYWILYHAYESPKYSEGRKLCMDKLVFDNDGWPSVKNKMPSKIRTEAPFFKK